MRKRYFAIVALLIALFPFVAIWLSAHQVIAVQVDFRLRATCFLFSVLLLLYCIIKSMGNRKRSRYIMLLACLSSLLTVFISYRFANKMFAYCVVDSVSVSTWMELASQINPVAESAFREGRFELTKEEIPRDFDLYLGRRNEFKWAQVGRRDGSVVTTVIYGGRLREWGVVIGASKYESEDLRFMSRIGVASNVLFVLGVAP
jgi:hypothetical protein